jgi:hypothetical protein
VPAAICFVPGFWPLKIAPGVVLPNATPGGILEWQAAQTRRVIQLTPTLRTLLNLVFKKCRAISLALVSQHAAFAKQHIVVVA